MRSLLPILLIAACGGAPSASDVAAVLDDFHDAASKADGPRYFAHFAPEGVFLGTDATERWTVDEFRKYAHPHFDKGNGWTYTPRDRFVTFSPGGDVAWFDEMLDNASYGELRGTGALRLIDGTWKITHYNLTFTVPNDAAKDVVARIRGGPDRELLHEGKSIVLSMKAPRINRLVVYEDEEYGFFCRDSDSGRHIPGLFVFRRKTGTWMQIRKLATAGATLGYTSKLEETGKLEPITLSVGWDHTRLAEQPFVEVPQTRGWGLRRPDRVVREATTYRIQFNTATARSLKRDHVVTEFVVDKRDLDRAFID